ncbi:translation initiation factor 2 subunit 2 [Pelomyxa schiedti]|nr:translation initiation factor 2 subunit 2 [Pelomyxa schiedti]
MSTAADQQNAAQFNANRKKKAKKPPTIATTTSPPQPSTTAAPEVIPSVPNSVSVDVPKPVSNETATGTPPSTSSDQTANYNTSDYNYDKLLQRLVDKMSASGRELGPHKNSIVIHPPMLLRDGWKTSWANFAEFCATFVLSLLPKQPNHYTPPTKRFNRPESHVLKFVENELSVLVSINGSHHLALRGRFKIRSVEATMKKYIVEYVRCKTCNSVNTTLKKVHKLQQLTCCDCGSLRTVAPIVSSSVKKPPPQAQPTSND